jgi:23S rRNA maturation mini-RNase III
MSFHADELRKIQTATSGIFKGRARAAISTALQELKPKIDAVKRLQGEAQAAALRELMNEATAARQEAMRRGAHSYGHPSWAAAAACESWIQALAMEDPEDLPGVESLIAELASRK